MKATGVALALTLCLPLAACGVQGSGLDANTAVTISGKAIGADGKPQAGTKVVLLKELDLGEVVGGLFLTAASLGIACLADHPPALCAKNAHVATTNAGGSFSFAVKGSDTQGSFGVASTMALIIRGAAGAGEVAGPTAMAEFNIQAASLSVPDLRLWRPRVSLAQDGRASWEALPGDYGSSPAYSIEVSDLHGNQWWTARVTRSGDRIEPRVLEDVQGTFDVAARARGTANGTTVDWTYTSGSGSIRGSAGAPPSRGAPCAPVMASRAGSFAACPLTSGAIGGGSQVFSGAGAVVIDLGLERAVSLVVLRGCGGSCTVALSDDDVGWSDVSTVSGRYSTAALASARQARYARVSAASGVSGLGQVSVW